MNTASIIQRLLRSVAKANGPRAKGADRFTRKTVTLCRALLSQRGEASGAALAREALNAYKALQGSSLEAFFDVLANEFSPDPEEVGRAADAYRRESTQPNLVRLVNVVEPRRQELFRRLNLAAGGTAARSSDAATGSVMVSRRSAGTSVNTCVSPLGHTTLSRLTRASSPRPKCTIGSLLEL